MHDAKGSFFHQALLHETCGYNPILKLRACQRVSILLCTLHKWRTTWLPAEPEQRCRPSVRAGTSKATRKRQERAMARAQSSGPKVRASLATSSCSRILNFVLERILSRQKCRSTMRADTPELR